MSAIARERARLDAWLRRIRLEAPPGSLASRYADAALKGAEPGAEPAPERSVAESVDDFAAAVRRKARAPSARRTPED